MEVRDCTPSVMAKLMGMDELLPQQHIHKRQRVLSDNYLRKTASIGLWQKQSFDEGCSFRKRIAKQQEFKDGFEVPEVMMNTAVHIQSVSSKKRNLSIADARMSSLSQRFTDAKQISIDEKLQHSKKFVDLREDLNDNNNNISLRCQQPDALFTKHLHDQQNIEPHFLFTPVTGFKASNVLRNKNTVTCCKKGKVLRSFQKFETGSVINSYRTREIKRSPNFFKPWLELKNKSSLFPSRMLILKPNSRKGKNETKFLFSPGTCLGSSSAGRKSREHIKSINGATYGELQDIDELVNEPSRHDVRVSNEIAKDTIKLVSNGICSSEEVLELEHKVDGASTNDASVSLPSRTTFYDQEKQKYETSNLPSSGLHITAETNKQLSGQWTVAETLQDVEGAKRSCTPGETLSNPDQKTPNKLNFKPGCHRISEGNTDLGFSRKDECISKFRRSSSFPASFSGIISPKPWTKNEACHGVQYFKLEEDVTVGENFSINQNFSKKGNAKHRDLKFSSKKSRGYPLVVLKGNCTAQKKHEILDNKVDEGGLSEEYSAVSKLSIRTPFLESIQGSNVIQDELIKGFEENDMFKKNGSHFILKSSDSSVAPARMVTLVAAAVKADNFDVSSGTTNEKDNHSSPQFQDTKTRQEISIRSPERKMEFLNDSGSDPELSKILRNAYEHSPISVLEPFFTEDSFGDSEFFKSVNSDLHGVRRQLQLFEELDETCSGGSGMAISSDEDIEERTLSSLEENGQSMELFRAQKSRDFLYLIDILDEAGFGGENLEMTSERWNSPECFISPAVFEALEKKYDKQLSWQVSERRLLFDRVNSGLMEILQPYIDVCILKKPLRQRISPKMKRHVIEEDMWKLLVGQGKEMNKDLSEKAVGNEMRWIQLGDDILSIGREVEEFIFDELVEELVV